MLDFLLHLFDPAEPPTAVHGGALSTPSGWFHFAADMSIFFTYAVLCTLLMIFLFGRKSLPNRSTVWMIWLFMLACGITRLVAAAMLYYPAFRLLLVVKVVTAGISIATVIAVARVFPAMLMMDPRAKPDAGRGGSRPLHRNGDETFVDQRNQLEQRASQLTVRDRRIRRALDSSASAACSWDIETNRIYWEVGLKALFLNQSDEVEPAHSWSELLSEPDRSRLQAAAKQAAASGEELQLEIPVSPASGREGTLRIRARVDTGSSAAKSAFTGLVTLVSADVAA
ncbi:MAG: hypothetical protein KF691_07380 [Phycisphaeraceae bacterium]|nr:hypothetical protein [Phycisphaeraceae bacterium]